MKPKVVILSPDDPFLDGDPVDFPSREEAMAEYRLLWLDFLQGKSEVYFGDRLAPVEESRVRMDALQSSICRGPGPLWRDFVATLPGFQEWWDGTATDITETYMEKVGLADGDET